MNETHRKPRRARKRWAGFFVSFIVVCGIGARSPAQSEPPRAANGQAPDKSGKSREFASGVIIDWDELAVRVDAKVVLREGPLELFACSPQTREHESIVSALARPLHIFQAMGLVGLESGSPPSYNEKADQWQRAHGEPLDLRVEWQDGDKVQSAKPAAWMIEKKTGKPPEDLGWVFSGSVVREKGHFGADADGTVVCVVDFDSALISLSTGHSADDAELWLKANPDAIPPLGTRCTLVIRSAYDPKLEVELNSEGRVKLDDEMLSIEEVGARLSQRRDDRSPRLFVSYHGSDQDRAIRNTLDALKNELEKRGLDSKKNMSLRKKGPPPASQPSAPDP